jgi:PAS domain S-box-containing protein
MHKLQGLNGMDYVKKKIGLVHTIRRITIITYGIAVICFALIGIFDKSLFLKNETNKIRSAYTEEQKSIVKTQVKSAVQFIKLSANTGISRDDILESLKGIRFGSDRDGYIFVNTYNGIPLLFDAKRVIGGDSIWELTDPNGVKVIQERRAVRNPEGDFIYYSWLKLSTNSISPKVSFIKGVPEWEWLVGAGVYLDSIDNEITVLQGRVIKETVIEASVLLIIVAIILFIVQLIFRRFTISVEDEIRLFSSYFDDAAIKSEEINLSNIKYQEFLNIAEDMNQMVANKLEAELQRVSSDKLLRLQREQSPLGYIEYDLDSNIVYWNPSAERIFGYSKKEILGNNDDIIMPAEVIPGIRQLFKDMKNDFVDGDSGAKYINDNITKSGKRMV